MTKSELSQKIYDCVNTDDSEPQLSHGKVVYNNVIYSIQHWYKTPTDEYCLWANNGSTSLCDYKTNDQDSAIELFVDAIMNFDAGFINCSDCGKRIKKLEIAGTYFAGSYCKDCWEGKWKAIEAEETYN